MAIVNLSADGMNVAMEESIAVCKSNSGICGKKLRVAHMQLGNSVGRRISAENTDANYVAVVVMMRAGLPFALGIADGLEDSGKTVSMFFSTKEKPLPDEFNYQRYSLIILSDAVIRTGKGIIALADSIDNKKITFATNVLDETGIPSFVGRTVYTTRISKNSFIGAAQNTVSEGKGPDTGDRLFNSKFMKGN